MQIQAAFITLLLAASASAEGISKRALVPRELSIRQSDTCPIGYKVCGQVCIELSATCCPDQAGGCPSTEECQLGDNGEYGCCAKGENCTGDGGAITSTPDPSSTTRFGGAFTTTPFASFSSLPIPSITPLFSTTPGATAGSGGSGGGNAAGHTFGSLSSALVYGGSAAAAVLTLVAALAL